MKPNKSPLQMNDIEASLSYLNIAKERMTQAGEPNIANLIGGLMGKIETLRATLKAVGYV